MNEYSDQDWQRLGQAVKRARKRMPALADTKAWASQVQRSSRTLLGLERGESVGQDTLFRIEEELRWPDGTAEKILAGAQPPETERIDINVRTSEVQMLMDLAVRRGLGIGALAEQMSVSEDRLREWIVGVDTDGMQVTFPASDLARLAQVIDVFPGTLSAFGRDDAAAALVAMRDESAARDLSKRLDSVEIARRLESMAKRMGEIEHDYQARIEELEDQVRELRESQDDD